MSRQEGQKPQGIQVISRAADILRVLGQETEGLSLGQIARHVNLPRSTVQRIVAALAVEGFISADKGYGGIRLGPEIQSLAQASAAAMKDRLRPIMHKLSALTGETVDLAIFDNDKMLFIDQVVGSHRLRTVSSIGEAFPLTSTANGKAALALIAPEHADALIEKEIGADKVAEIEALKAEIDAIRGGQLASDEDEHTEGISALGIALKDPDGKILALSTPVPSARYVRVKDTLAEAIRSSCAEFVI